MIYPSYMLLPNDMSEGGIATVNSAVLVLLIKSNLFNKIISKDISMMWDTVANTVSDNRLYFVHNLHDLLITHALIVGHT